MLFRSLSATDLRHSSMAASYCPRCEWAWHLMKCQKVSSGSWGLRRIALSTRVKASAAPAVSSTTQNRPLTDPPVGASPSRIRQVLDRPLTSYQLVIGVSALLLSLGVVMVLSASSVLPSTEDDEPQRW